MKKEPIIRIEDVWKIYQMGHTKVNALQGLNLDVRPGEFLAVMGKSGSGKSTSLNMIGALDIPTRGKIFLDGKDISKLEESDLAQIRGKKIGFIFQQFNLIHSLSALENVMLPITFANLPEEEKIKKAKDLLKLVELEERMNHKPNELSGGQQQRVAIARALINDPEMILADEPTGNLDLKTGDKIMLLLKNLHRHENKTIVVVTHDEDIAHVAERICYLEDGKIKKCYTNGKYINLGGQK